NVRDPAAQYERCEGAAHPAQLVIAAPLRKNPTVKGVEDRCPGASNFHGFWQIAQTIKKSAYRSFRSHTAALRAADAVGNRGDDVTARLRQFHAENRASEILVAFTRARLRGKAHARFDRRRYFRHDARSGGVASAPRNWGNSSKIKKVDVNTADTVLIFERAAIKEEITASARGNDHGQISGFTVKRIIAAIGSVVPGDFGLGDPCRIGIDGAALVIDPDLPACAASRIGAGDGTFGRICNAEPLACHHNGQTKPR